MLRFDSECFEIAKEFGTSPYSPALCMLTLCILAAMDKYLFLEEYVRAHKALSELGCNNASLVSIEET
eukprot:9022608-Pyramimonas_sp.AAC.1